MAVKESFSRFINVFFAPEKMATSIVENPTRNGVILPLLLLIIASVISMQVLKPVLHDVGVKKIQTDQRFSDEQRAQMLERVEAQSTSNIQLIFGVLTPIVGALLVGSLFYFVGTFIGGGETSWLILFLTAAYVECINIVASLLKVPLIVAKNSVEVQTSLALLFKEVDYHNVLFKLAAQVDIFRLWKIAVWVIAFQVIFKFSRNKSLALVVSIFVVWSIISFFTMGIGK